jgi:hypothetical protein
MAGLEPAIHRLRETSFFFATLFFVKEMAPRVISASTRVFDALLPAGDVSGYVAVNQTTRQRGYGAAAMTASS